MYRLFPYPPPLTHTLAVLTALSTSVAAFVLLRRLEGIGYAIEWRTRFRLELRAPFRDFCRHRHTDRDQDSFPDLRSHVRALAFPAPYRAWHFIFYGVAGGISFPRTAAEFSDANVQEPWAGLVVASAIFGLSHIVHAPYPNWKYVLLATVAGLFYGHAWMRTRSLFPGTLIHALVDISWHFLFR